MWGISEQNGNMWSTCITICKTPKRYFCNTLANTCFIFREEPPSFLEILSMIPVNIVSPFLYVMDIVKDLVQFGLLAVAVGGLSKFLEYWSSFSSMVSKYIHFLFCVTYHTFGSVCFSKMYCYLLKVFSDKSQSFLPSTLLILYYTLPRVLQHRVYKNSGFIK